MRDPRLSIVLPSRNGVRRLGPMLSGLLAEIGRARVAAEIVAVDDGSTDGTMGLLARLGAEAPAIRPVAGPGRGPGAARNVGIRAARGALVAFADDDDPWTPGRLANQLAAHAAHPDAIFSLCDYGHVREDGPAEALPSAFAYWPLWRRFRHAAVTRLDDGRALIAAENAVGTSTVMARRDALLRVGGFDETLPSASDWDLWLRLAALGPVLALGQEGARYTMRSRSVSADRSARLEAMRAILARHGDLPGWSRRRAEARIAAGHGEAAEARGDGVAALRHALVALRLDPGRRRLRRLVSLAGAVVARRSGPGAPEAGSR